ncbi:MAG: radical SAM protein [Bacilli bacterium]|nr:radical SAM protein [Bacilli bacterium]
MKFILHDLAIETTRRCNLRCEHCMRGESQNIDASKEIIDMILNNDEIKRIDHICFSGGEPTLNPNIIIYAINKIITENIDVLEIVMVTNGQIFNKDLVEAFNRFNEYRNQRIKKQLTAHYNELGKDALNSIIQDNTDEHARITFSIDRFHYPISKEVRDNYKKYARGIKITEKDVDDEDIYKTGFATIGKDFNYKLDQLRYCKDGEYYMVIDNMYITSTGFITSEGMGQYSDMDRINMGHLSNTTLSEILATYGTPVMNAPRIVLEKNGPIKR